MLVTTAAVGVGEDDDIGVGSACWAGRDVGESGVLRLLPTTGAVLLDEHLSMSAHRLERSWSEGTHLQACPAAIVGAVT